MNRRFLFSLVLVDALLILLYFVAVLVSRSGYIEGVPALFHIEQDWSLGEMFNYIKWSILIFIFLGAFSQRREVVLLAFAAFALILLLDDSLQLHEQGGARVMAALGIERVAQTLAPNLAAMSIWVVLGAVGAIGIFLTWRRSDPVLRAKAIPMAWILVGILFFGVVVDTLHFLMPPSLETNLVGVVEDGGEMIMASLLVAYAWQAYRVELWRA